MSKRTLRKHKSRLSKKRNLKIKSVSRHRKCRRFSKYLPFIGGMDQQPPPPQNNQAMTTPPQGPRIARTNVVSPTTPPNGTTIGVANVVSPTTPPNGTTIGVANVATPNTPPRQGILATPGSPPRVRPRRVFQIQGRPFNNPMQPRNLDDAMNNVR